MRKGSVADLLPVLTVEENHFVTLDGRMGVALACSGVNIGIKSDEAAESVAALFAQSLNYCSVTIGLMDKGA